MLGTHVFQFHLSPFLKLPPEQSNSCWFYKIYKCYCEPLGYKAIQGDGYQSNKREQRTQSGSHIEDCGMAGT